MALFKYQATVNLLLRKHAAAVLAGLSVFITCYSAVGMHNDVVVATSAATSIRSTGTIFLVAAGAAALLEAPEERPGVAPFDGATGEAELRQGDATADDSD